MLEWRLWTVCNTVLLRADSVEYVRRGWYVQKYKGMYFGAVMCGKCHRFNIASLFVRRTANVIRSTAYQGRNSLATLASVIPNLHRFANLTICRAIGQRIPT